MCPRSTIDRWLAIGEQRLKKTADPEPLILKQVGERRGRSDLMFN
ncbi:hypothetical protein [Microcoleus anatoxicus]|uniref:Transposase n=1 Tax=Microcoleus anatoxicus PTRS2 TaxID=2705321 RepID=A0ABU8YGW3_9CYAN